MFAYCNLDNNLTTDKDSFTQFEVLNELKNLDNRYDSNCLYHTRFLFEFDKLSLEDQKKLIEKRKNIIRRATFSGSKSYHVIVEFDKKFENFCASHYKIIWNIINETLFDSNADKACSNPARLTRKPNGLREKEEGYVKQTLLFENETYLSVSQNLRDHVLSKVVIPEIKKTKKPNIHDGLCKTYEPVVHYMTHSYPLMKGNGDSSSSLFKAMRCCIKYNDNRTLDEIMDKALREHWTMYELERIEDQIKKKYI